MSFQIQMSSGKTLHKRNAHTDFTKLEGPPMVTCECDEALLVSDLLLLYGQLILPGPCDRHLIRFHFSRDNGLNNHRKQPYTKGNFCIAARGLNSVHHRPCSEIKQADCDEQVKSS